ncbi:hypothetical protein GC105_11760 [Alkalibaculum sp. M08DMB]|uniref:Uncharacterized protein n=1 Tax=Alkalibaculum sporogenes TaxID=2655001 RepID=A0A6A7KAP4_9FIRM|nr:hypothetical protein [Alkalibaculum sporogenes]MPW26466.1 hypothetical protein [Alkalibaculum sporogenes]
MSSMVAFLNITIFIIILFLSFHLIKGNTAKPRKKIFKVKILHTILFSYVFLLLVGIILYAFIPSEKYEYMEFKENHESYQPNTSFDAIYEGMIDKNIKIGDKFTFNYTDDTLEVSANKDEEFSLTIVVEKKDTNDEVIELTNYLNTTIVDNIDFTETIPSVDAKISGNTLILQEPDTVEITISKLKKEFTISQFTSESHMDNIGHGFNGESLLYIKIPKDLELISSMNDIYIHYVNE